LTSNFQPKATIINTLKGHTDDPDSNAHPTADDQLRLVIIYYLSAADQVLSKDDLAELTEMLKTAGANVAALEYVKR
jgi:sec1 family domain-containing protein 1